MKKKEIHIVEAKVEFQDGSIGVISLNVDADGMMHEAEQKAQTWLESGTSGYKIAEVRAVHAVRNAYVIV